MSTAVVKRVGKLEVVKEYLDTSRENFIRLLPNRRQRERFELLVASACKQVPKLLLCSRSSLFAAIADCAELGLEPNSPLGEGWLIPYGEDAKFIPGYKGFVKLARQNGVGEVHAGCVWPQDRFKYIDGVETILEHEPKYGPRRDPKDITCVWATARLKTGRSQAAVMDIEKVLEIKGRSASARSKRRSPWDTDFEEMAKKTAVRRLAKLLPVSNSRWSKLLEVDDKDFPEELQPPPVVQSKPLVAVPAADEPTASSSSSPADSSPTPAAPSSANTTSSASSATAVQPPVSKPSATSVTNSPAAPPASPSGPSPMKESPATPTPVAQTNARRSGKTTAAKAEAIQHLRDKVAEVQASGVFADLDWEWAEEQDLETLRKTWAEFDAKVKR